MVKTGLTQRAATVLFGKAVVVLSWKIEGTQAMEAQRKGCLSRSIALRTVRNLRMQAIRATFLSLPRFSNCWYWARIRGLRRVATRVAM
jgi:hypothetical protein